MPPAEERRSDSCFLQLRCSWERRFISPSPISLIPPWPKASSTTSERRGRDARLEKPLGDAGLAQRTEPNRLGTLLYFGGRRVDDRQEHRGPSPSAAKLRRLLPTVAGGRRHPRVVGESERCEPRLSGDDRCVDLKEGLCATAQSFLDE